MTNSPATPKFKNVVNEFLLPMKALMYPIAQKPGASENGSWAGVFFNQVLFMLCLKKNAMLGK